jgi:hypothetical protein
MLDIIFYMRQHYFTQKVCVLDSMELKEMYCFLIEFNIEITFNGVF